MTRLIHRHAPAAGLFAVLSVIAACGMTTAKAQDAPDYAAIVAAPDRSDADRQTDQRRAPVKMLAFTGARPGMKVFDMEAGAGYSTELLRARWRLAASSTARTRLPSWSASRTNSTSARKAPR